MIEIHPLIAAATSAAVGLIFLWAGTHKLIDFQSFVALLMQIPLVPVHLARPLGVTIVISEIAIGVGLWLGVVWASYVAISMLSVFSLAALVIFYTFGPLTCNCFGKEGRSILGWSTVLRNIVLTTLCRLGIGANVFAFGAVLPIVIATMAMIGLAIPAIYLNQKSISAIIRG